MKIKKSFSIKKMNTVLLICLAFMGLGSMVAASGLQPVSERVPTFSDNNGFGPSDIYPATAEELAEAMGVPAADLISASLMGSDPDGVGVSDAPLGLVGFPTDGTTFAILATGLAADAELPNDTGSLTTVLDGLNNDQGEDLVRLHLELKVPAEYDCVSFDFAFYSEEFPEWVGSQYNDTFTAQLNNSFLAIDNNNQVVAPGNFTFDAQGNMISINTIWGVSEPTGTTYDGGTARIQGHTAVVPNSTINIYLSIQDVGDSLYDSAVFLDNFFWSKDPGCMSGASIDSDNDGLLDDWEISGLTVMVGGIPQFVDLPAMGADPMHKDVFVEIDYMDGGGHSHKPNDGAISKIVTAFNNAPVSNPDGSTGIHLHVDYGSSAPLTWGAATTWGVLSRSTVLPHQNFISTCTFIDGTLEEFHWDGFDTIKTANFRAERASVFHYNVWAHRLCMGDDGVSGISRNNLDASFGDGASDFIVSLGSWTGGTGSEKEQAGTFMHELGHNLGLRHGGPDHRNYKPNYLSVMSYAFQTRGLTINGVSDKFDYSRYDLPDLDETHLDEPDGINVPVFVSDILGTRYYCGTMLTLDLDARVVDWNCDGDGSDTAVSRDINKDGFLTILTSHNDWDNLVFLGGAIGRLGATVEMPSIGDVIDINVTQDQWLDVNSAVFLPAVLKPQ